MGVKEKPDIIDITEKKRLQWYGHIKRMQEERLPKLIMEWGFCECGNDFDRSVKDVSYTVT
jgi:hypothetical protein